MQPPSGHSNTQRAQRAGQHPLHLSSRPPGVGTRQRAQDRTGIAASLRPYLRSSTAPRRACGLHSGHVHGRHQVPHLLERAFPSQPRHTVAQQSSTSPGVRVAAAPEPIGPGLGGNEPARVAGAGPAAMAVHIVHTLLYAVHPKQPGQSGRRRSRAANSNNSPPPCVPVADSRAQLAMGGQERFRRAGCQSESGGLPFLAVAGSTRASLLTPQFGQVLLKAVCGPLRARLMSNTWSDVRRRPWSPRTADHAPSSAAPVCLASQPPSAAEHRSQPRPWSGAEPSARCAAGRPATTSKPAGPHLAFVALFARVGSVCWGVSVRPAELAGVSRYPDGACRRHSDQRRAHLGRDA